MEKGLDRVAIISTGKHLITLNIRDKVCNRICGRCPKRIHGYCNSCRLCCSEKIKRYVSCCTNLRGVNDSIDCKDLSSGTLSEIEGEGARCRNSYLVMQILQ